MPDIVSRYVGVCIFRHREGTEYLLLQRAAGERVYPGVWQYVTGKMLPGEKALDAARRELYEETSLTPLRWWVVPCCPSFFDPAADAIHLTPLFLAQVAPAAIPVLSPEHTSFRWETIGPATRLLVWPGQREGIRIAHDYIVCDVGTSLLSACPPSRPGTESS